MVFPYLSTFITGKEGHTDLSEKVTQQVLDLPSRE